jgi:MOSC domain-containing protein YiiM
MEAAERDAVHPVHHTGAAELEAGRERLRTAPADEGTVDLVVVRPGRFLRRVVEEGEIDLEQGMVGDRWTVRKKGVDDQITVTNARYLELIAGGRDPERWAQAGDQLYVDYDISHTNLPVGSRFTVGEVVLEVSPDPHHGCGKYMKRFGVQAMKFANTEEGRELRLRGLHARVIEPGVVRRGDRIAKLPARPG